MRVETILHLEPGVNRNARPQQPDRVETESCEIRGPVLGIGGRPQTFALTRDPKLVLNAVVPFRAEAGKTRWYYATCERAADGSPMSVVETLFDFTDDPLTHDSGRGSIRARVGDFPTKTNDMRFTVTRVQKTLRFVQIDVDGPNGVVHRARLALVTSGEYGLMLDNPNRNSVTFTPAPNDPQAPNPIRR